MNNTDLLSKDQGKKLLLFTRNSIKDKLAHENTNIDTYSEFDKKQGVFVTLHKNHSLRGCIGFPHPTHKLYIATHNAAISAAFEDPRFPSLKRSELKDINIEISVLTIPEKIQISNPEEYKEHIEIEKHGLILQNNHTSGLLLPQVFTEYNCDWKQALEMLCQKAGLPKNAWKDTANKIFRFQAQIFNENNL